MDHFTGHPIFRRMDELELAVCLLLNRASEAGHICRFFALISRLGNGVFWYSLIILLPFIFGLQGLHAAIHMTIVGLIGTALYKFLKKRMIRHRPCVQHKDIRLGTAPLDHYSFPSGHTLHAVIFSTIAISYFPVLAWLLVPFASLIALSRIILGLHYPSDVAAGAVIGAVLAGITL